MRAMMGVCPSFLLVMAVAVGCGTDAPGGPMMYTTSDSGGVEIVESAGPTWPSESREVAVEPLLRMGREEAGPYQFTAVPFGLLLSDGRMVVGDLGTQEVRAFDPSGEHVSTFGGRGEGPGEFSGLSGLFLYRGDSIVAMDGRLARSTVLEMTSGSYRTIAHEVSGNYYVFGVLQDSILLLYSPGRSYHPGLEPGRQWVSTEVLAIGPGGGAPRVLGGLPGQERFVGTDGNAPMVIPNRYAVQAVADLGFYWATSDDYSIQYYDGDGSLRRVLRRAVDPKPVEQWMIDEYIEAQLERVRQREGDGAVAEYRRTYEDRAYGEEIPLFSTAFVDHNNRLWIAEASWPTASESRRWDVFSDEGYWSGTVEAPDRLSILAVRDDRVLGVWRDELDVPHVHLHEFR